MKRSLIALLIHVIMIIVLNKLKFLIKTKKKIIDEKEEEEHRSKLEQDWNDIQNLLLNKN